MSPRTPDTNAIIYVKEVTFPRNLLRAFPSICRASYRDVNGFSRHSLLTRSVSETEQTGIWCWQKFTVKNYTSFGNSKMRLPSSVCSLLQNVYFVCGRTLSKVSLGESATFGRPSWPSWQHNGTSWFHRKHFWSETVDVMLWFDCLYCFNVHSEVCFTAWGRPGRDAVFPEATS